MNVELTFWECHFGTSGSCLWVLPKSFCRNSQTSVPYSVYCVRWVSSWLLRIFSFFQLQLSLKSSKNAMWGFRTRQSPLCLISRPFTPFMEVYTYVHMYVYIHMYVCVCVCVHIYVCVCKDIYIYIHMNQSDTSVHVCVCTYIYIYIYIYI